MLWPAKSRGESSSMRISGRLIILTGTQTFAFHSGGTGSGVLCSSCCDLIIQQMSIRFFFLVDACSKLTRPVLINHGVINCVSKDRGNAVKYLCCMCWCGSGAGSGSEAGCHTGLQSAFDQLLLLWVCYPVALADSMTGLNVGQEGGNFSGCVHSRCKEHD